MVLAYSESLLKIAIAQLGLNVGWHGIGSNSYEVLIDVCARYIREIGRCSQSIANQYNRTQVNFDDLQMAFDRLGISLTELEDYFLHVEPIPFARGKVPKFPASIKSTLRITPAEETEANTRSDIYFPWLPSICFSAENMLLDSKKFYR